MSDTTTAAGFVVLVVNDWQPPSAHLAWQGRIYPTHEAAQHAAHNERAMFPGRAKHIQVIEIGGAA